MHLGTTIALGLSLLLPMSGAMAASVTVDGVKNGDDAYTDSFSTGWVNGHKNEYSLYGGDIAANQTRVHYATESNKLFVYIEVPLYAKNMIWGNGVSEEDAADYQRQFVTHHAGKTVNLDYNGATGSEIAIFSGVTAYLNSGDGGKAKKGKKGKKEAKADNGPGMTASANSAQYLIAQGTCDTTNCAARNTRMSFEFEFTLDSTGQDAVISDLRTKGIEFHLSPERGLTAVPLPAAAWLFGSAIFGLTAVARRRKIPAPTTETGIQPLSRRK